MILKPAEFANGSPDKALYGLNASYKIADRYVAYGQLMINEFTVKEDILQERVIGLISKDYSWVLKVLTFLRLKI